MSKPISVRIRKAKDGEQPGFYNQNQVKTANFLKKAQVGMQVGSGNINENERIKVVLSNAYAAIKDGMQPDLVFQSLVTKYAMSQEMAYQIVHTVMTKLAEQGYVDPAYLNQDEEGEEQTQQQSEQEQPQATAQQQAVTPNEDEELALSMAEEGSSDDALSQLYGGMGTEEMQQQQAFQYGGYFAEGGDMEYENYFENGTTPEDAVIGQYGNPGQLNKNQREPFSLEKLIKFTPGAQEYPQTPDLSYYLGNYVDVANMDIPTELLPMSDYKFGGQTTLQKFTKGGPKKKGKRKTKEPETVTEETVTTPTAETVSNIRVTPQTISSVPNMYQSFLNRYNTRNPLSNRGILGTTAEAIGTGVNFIRPQNWAEKSKLFGMIGGRELVAPSTTSTEILLDLNNIIKDKDYVPKVLEKNEDGTYGSGANFNLGPDLATTLLETAKSADLKAGKSLEIAFPKSTYPELDFLSLHTLGEKSKIILTKDKGNLLKAQIVSEVPTKLRGYDQKGLTIKDEVIIDTKKNEIKDPKTGLPLETFNKSFYTGNQLNWWNNPSMPAAKLEGFPKVFSLDPLKTEKPSTGNILWNTVGKPITFGGLSAFTYPRFQAGSKFYPNAAKIETDFLGRGVETGTEGTGTTNTFGTQDLGSQYADYLMLKDRNYRTGLNVLKGTALLGGLGLYGMSLYSNPGEDELYDKTFTSTPNRSDYDYIGAGRSYDTLRFGLGTSIYDKDSMYVSPSGDTLYNKFYQQPLSDDYKKGGALKKKFIKRVTQMFAPGGETEDQNMGLGKGNRMDNNTNEVTKRKSNFINKLKTNSDKAATEDLYNKVQQTGDPNLINIFMGQDQNSNQSMQQPMPNNMMAEGGSMDPCPEGMVYDPIYGCIPAADKNMKEYSPEQINEYFDSYYKSNRPFGEIEENINPDYWNQPKSNFFRKMMDDNNVPYIETNPGQYTIPYDQLTKEQKLQLWYLNEGYTQQKLEILNQMGIPPNEWMDYIQNMELQEDSTPFPSYRDNEQFQQLYRDMDDQYEDRLRDCPCRQRQIVNNQIKEICVPCEEEGYAQFGGFTDMSVPNPLTRFVYGGDDNPPYEPYNLPEASNGITIQNKEGQLRGVQSRMDFDDWAEGERADWEAANPGGDFDAWKNDAAAQEQYEQYQNFYDESLDSYFDYDDPNTNPAVITTNSLKNTTMCGPGMMWSKTYNQCIPVAQIKYNPRYVRSAPTLASTLLPWNPIFRRGSYTQFQDPFRLSNLKKYTGALGQPVATIKTRENWLSPKTVMDIYNPDGIWSQADLEKLIEYRGGKGKGSKKDKEGKSSRKALRNEDIPSDSFYRTKTGKDGEDRGVNRKGQLVSRPNPMEGASIPTGFDDKGNTIYGQYGKRDHLRNQLWLNDKTMKDYRKEGPSIFGNTMFGDQEEMAEKYSKKGALGKARMRNQFNKTGLWKLPLNKKK